MMTSGDFRFDPFVECAAERMQDLTLAFSQTAQEAPDAVNASLAGRIVSTVPAMRTQIARFA
jgi:hypothetical protein